MMNNATKNSVIKKNDQPIILTGNPSIMIKYFLHLPLKQ